MLCRASCEVDVAVGAALGDDELEVRALGIEHASTNAVLELQELALEREPDAGIAGAAGAGLVGGVLGPRANDLKVVLAEAFVVEEGLYGVFAWRCVHGASIELSAIDRRRGGIERSGVGH